MKTIRKDYQGTIPANKILNEQTDSNTDTYSCDYINNMTFSGSGGGGDTLPIGAIVHFDGDVIPEGYEKYEDSINTFSEEETIVGTWFGKPLYRKTVSTKELLSANNTIKVVHGIENMNVFWIDNSYSFFLAASGLSYTLPMIGYQGNTTDKSYAYADKTNVYIYSNGSWSTGWTKVITLLYTKTTD